MNMWYATILLLVQVCTLASLSYISSHPQGVGGGDSSCAHYARAEGEEYACAGGGPSQGSAHSGPGTHRVGHCH